MMRHASDIADVIEMVLPSIKLLYDPNGGQWLSLTEAGDAGEAIDNVLG